MIAIQLPNGEQINVDTDDVQAAARAGRIVWERQQAEKGLNAEIAPPILGEGGQEIPWWEQAAPVTPQARPELEIGGDAGRGLQIGSQGAGRGLAELAGAPVDIATMLLNMVPWAAESAANAVLPDDEEIAVGRITNPVGGGQWIREHASGAAEAAGLDLIDESEMGASERGAYNVNRLGTEALAGAGVGNAVNRGAKVGTTLERYTQPFASPTSRSAAVDTAAGAGSGTALTASQELFPDSPIADLVAVLAGGLTGGRLAQVAHSPAAAGRAIERSLPDPEVSGATRAQADRAAELVQGRTSGRREDVAERIGQVARESADEGDPAPTSGVASGDIGLTALERGARLRDPVPFQERDQALRDAAQERVTGLRDPEADPRAAQRRVREDVAAQREAAQQPIGRARQELTETQAANTKQLTDAETARERTLAEQDRRVAQTRERRSAAEEVEREIGGEVQGRLGGEVAASEEVAGAVGTAKGAAEARKSSLYREAETRGRESSIDPTPLAEDARAVRAEISPLAQQDPQLSNILDDLDRLAPVVADGTATPEALSVADLIAMRPRLSSARASAVRLKRGDAVRRLDRINETIAGQLDELAEAGDPAALKWREAEANFRDEFAPRYREGVGADLDRAERAGRPVPPSAVAEKFIRPGAGGKEAAEDLKRILAGAASEQQGAVAAREYVLADLARTVGSDGKINPSRLRTWIANREGMFQALPDLRAEVDQLLKDVVNKRKATGKLQGELESLTDEYRSLTVSTRKEINAVKANNKLSEADKQTEIARLEDEAAEVEKSIRRNAASVLLDADPVIAAKRVLSDSAGDPERAMAEIVERLKGDREALKGWKEAVTEHLIERVTGTNTALTGGAEGPVSVAALKRFFDKRAGALAKVYSPSEMNALRRAHKILEPLGNLQRQAVAGSQTVANEQAWNALEAGLLATTGNAITTGMIMKRIRVVLRLMPSRQRAVEDLVNRMFFDPGLAQHLLVREPKKIDTPAWNKRLTRLLGVGEAAREAIDEDEAE